MHRERHSYHLCAKPFLTDIKVKKPGVAKAVGLLIQQKQQKHSVVTFNFCIWEGENRGIFSGNRQPPVFL